MKKSKCIALPLFCALRDLLSAETRAWRAAESKNKRGRGAALSNLAKAVRTAKAVLVESSPN